MEGDGGTPDPHPPEGLVAGVCLKSHFFFAGWSLRGLKIVNGNLGNGEKPSVSQNPGIYAEKGPKAFPSHTRAPARESLQREVLGNLFEQARSRASALGSRG